MKFDIRLLVLVALVAVSAPAHADDSDTSTSSDDNAPAYAPKGGFGGGRTESRPQEHVTIHENVTVHEQGGRERGPVITRPGRPNFVDRGHDRIVERSRLDGMHAAFRDGFFRMHPEVRADWRWEWRGGTCYGNGIVYGGDFCRAGLGSSYFWYGNECREYTPLGVFLAVTSDFSSCGAPELRMHFGWNGGTCWQYDIEGNPIEAIDLGFCRTQLGTHYGWMNGACAELTNDGNLFVAYTTTPQGYADATPCTVGSLAPFLAKKSSTDAVALEDAMSSKSTLPAEVQNGLNQASGFKGATQTAIE